ncbi:MAG TPA: lysophospholipid acyltransferase family protein [Candidatus Solibacter sp.]|jgi:1-acyl-sn-glycerol-3-phosphate acyltransferase|nr:lysophospholipid acyltransferase family protein [Candidatus Solibacter sp.]
MTETSVVATPAPVARGLVSPTPIYWLLRWFVQLVILLLVRGHLHIEGSENVPKKGGLLVISNHIASADPPILGGKFPRPLHFMAKVEWFRKAFVAFLARQFLCFPVVRHTADRGALRYTLALLASGEAVCIYPEGTRAEDARIHEVEAGVGFVARRSGVPILPVAVWGTENVLPAKGVHFPKAADCHMVYGKPFNLPRADMDNLEASRYMMSKVAEMLPVAYRGVFELYGSKTA